MSFRSLFFVLAFTFSCLASAQESVPLVSIIIDDMGEQKAAGDRALGLAGKVAYAVLPFGKFSAEHTRKAQIHGSEVLLHLPLEARSGNLHRAGLHSRQNKQELLASFRAALDSVPGVTGVNNHQGSLLTADAKRMHWLMFEMRSHPDLYFVDSMTHKDSVALKQARAQGIPSIRRDVFLDNDINIESVRKEFNRLIKRAKRDGYATAIGHPYPSTMAVLEDALKNNGKDLGVQLIMPSEMIRAQQGVPVYFRAAGKTVEYGKLSEKPVVKEVMMDTLAPVTAHFRSTDNMTMVPFLATRRDELTASSNATTDKDLLGPVSR